MIQPMLDIPQYVTGRLRIKVIDHAVRSQISITADKPWPSEFKCPGRNLVLFTAEGNAG
jgi:hypothetical protein